MLTVSKIKQHRDAHHDGMLHTVTFSNGVEVTLQRLRAAENLGIGGWYAVASNTDAVNLESGYLADTREEAINYLLRTLAAHDVQTVQPSDADTCEKFRRQMLVSASRARAEYLRAKHGAIKRARLLKLRSRTVLRAIESGAMSDCWVVMFRYTGLAVQFVNGKPRHAYALAATRYESRDVAATKAAQTWNGNNEQPEAVRLSDALREDLRCGAWFTA